MARLYNRSHDSAGEPPPESLQLPVHALLRRGAGGRVPHTRASPRPRARRDPPGSLRAEPPLAAAAGASPRSPRAREGARRAGHRRRARRDGRSLAGPLDDGRRDGDVPRREPVRLEDDDVLVVLAAGELTADDLLKLVHLEPVENAGLDGLDQVGRLE